MSLRVLVKNKIYLSNLIVMTVLWTASSFCYFLINFQMKYIHGNTFLNTGSAALSESIAYLCGGLLVKKFGAKKSFISAFLFSATGSLLIIFIPHTSVSGTAYAGFVMATGFGVAATFNMVFIVTADYFPPALLGSAFGFCNLFARSFTFLSP